VKWRRSMCITFLLVLVSWLMSYATSNGAWLAEVPQHDRTRTNPYANQSDAIAAGQRIFQDHCARCHGANADGTKKRPSLRSTRVQQEATDGDLHWLLVNGNRAQGMPSWIKLGDPQIWQVICYVKSLH
jgi:mono/diheme cytochrome c family protein